MKGSFVKSSMELTSIPLSLLEYRGLLEACLMVHASLLSWRDARSLAEVN
ncbi:MAG: hypothetical protein HA491_04245 [Candidatus Verstraetearchaeota archaeon]|nr:hypothetical protein [Candidatus Verstraetearchaeota archaeon]